MNGADTEGLSGPDCLDMLLWGKASGWIVSHVSADLYVDLTQRQAPGCSRPPASVMPHVS